MEAITIIMVVVYFIVALLGLAIMGHHIVTRICEKDENPTIKLPCNTGDVVWFETYNNKGIYNGLKPHEVLDFKVYAVVSSDRGYPCDIDISEFGKTVFLTKKGANTNEK